MTFSAAPSRCYLVGGRRGRGRTRGHRLLGLLAELRGWTQSRHDRAFAGGDAPAEQSRARRLHPAIEEEWAPPRAPCSWHQTGRKRRRRLEWSRGLRQVTPGKHALGCSSPENSKLCSLSTPEPVGCPGRCLPGATRNWRRLIPRSPRLEASRAARKAARARAFCLHFWAKGHRDCSPQACELGLASLL